MKPINTYFVGVSKDQDLSEPTNTYFINLINSVTSSSQDQSRKSEMTETLPETGPDDTGQTNKN